MAWTCFLIRPTRRYHKYVRRSAQGPCGKSAYHDSTTVIETFDLPAGAPDPVTETDHTMSPEMRALYAWPTQCSCGYVYVADDMRQLGYTVLYDDGNGRLFTLKNAPVGAMWHMPWMRHVTQWNRAADPSGPLCVRLPDGVDWFIDGPSKNGPGWVRHGDPPKITATPSIASSGYHGFLQNGVLTDDCEGRKFA